MGARVVFFVVTFAFLLINTYAACTKELGEAAQFSYSGATGPAEWGSLSPNFSTCSNGKLQSPINIVKDKVVIKKNLKPLIREYYPANATLINNGFNIMMRFEENAGVLISDGKNYTLKQVHWHSPSEHRIHEIQYDAELHLVHMAADGSISVVANLYHYGHADPILAKIHNKLGELANEKCPSNELAQISLGIFDTKQMEHDNRKYYKYIGSLTTPPCSQNVTWYILAKVSPISREQVEALKAPLELSSKNNARPVQALNGREIEMRARFDRKFMV